MLLDKRDRGVLFNNWFLNVNQIKVPTTTKSDYTVKQTALRNFATCIKMVSK